MNKCNCILAPFDSDPYLICITRLLIVAVGTISPFFRYSLHSFFFFLIRGDVTKYYALMNSISIKNTIFQSFKTLTILPPAAIANPHGFPATGQDTPTKTHNHASPSVLRPPNPPAKQCACCLFKRGRHDRRSSAITGSNE